MRYEKTSRQRRRGKTAQFSSTSQDHILVRKFDALSGRVTVWDGWEYSRTETIGWVQLVSNCDACQGRRSLALGGENDDVAVIFAPPFYVSKWRLGRLDWSSRHLASGVYPCVQINNLMHLQWFKAVGISEVCKLIVANWAWMPIMYWVVLSQSTYGLTFWLHCREANLANFNFSWR